MESDGIQGVIVLTLFKASDGTDRIDLTVSSALAREDVTDALAEVLLGLQQKQ